MMHDLVNGTVATGGGAFCPGRDFTPLYESDESEDHAIDPSLREEQSQSSSDPPSVRYKLVN